MPTIEEQLEALKQALSALQKDRISDVRRLNERIDTLQRQINEQRDRVAEQENQLLASFQDLAKYQIQTEQKIDERFDGVDARLAGVDARLDKIEATMATKDDIANMATKEDMASLELRMQRNLHAMEGRMLDAFKQVLVMIDSRLPPSAT